MFAGKWIGSRSAVSRASFFSLAKKGYEQAIKKLQRGTKSSIEIFDVLTMTACCATFLSFPSLLSHFIIMKAFAFTLLAVLGSGAQAFAPVSSGTARSLPSALSMAKYNTMDEILAKFPDDKPVLINFYDGNTESKIKNDIFRAKTLLADRCTLVSIKQQDYPELAKLWDCDQQSPAMILFKDGNPVTRLYGEDHYLEIVAKFGKLCEA